MTAPEQHLPPVYGCAAGAVLHAHAGSSLEPAVLLYTFLPPGVEDGLRTHDVRVDVHSDGPGSATVTVRVLLEQQSLSWQLAVAPLVAALPGQPGDEGRMVLLGVVDAEPDPGYWMAPVDCERLAAELQLPVVDLVDALRGRLTPWLADDVDVLLHDDAHEHAADQSPEQTLAAAVLRLYRGELDAEQAVKRLLRGLEFGAPEFQADLGRQLAYALWTAFAVSGQDAVEAVLSDTGPFESEVLRLLKEVPAALRGTDGVDGPVRTAEVLVGTGDRDEVIRAAVSVIARLVRAAFGHGRTDAQVLDRVGMVDDEGLARLADLWVGLAVAAGAPATGDAQAVADLAREVSGTGAAATRWLEATAVSLATLAHRLSGRRGRVQGALDEVLRLLEPGAPPGRALDPAAAADLLRPCLELARAVRAKAGLGPGRWLRLRPAPAATAVGIALVRGLRHDIAIDLLAELLDPELEAEHLLNGFVCATAQLLRQVEPDEVAEHADAHVERVLAALPSGARAARWLLVACLREAAEHDPSAPDLAGSVTREPSPDLERAADRAGVHGVLDAGVVALAALADEWGAYAGMGTEEVLGLLFPAALAEHELLRSTAPADLLELAERPTP